MADSSLDDFFAKKDKSKKKPKVKSGEGDTVPSKGKKEKKKDKDKINTTSSTGNKTVINNGQEDDDWNDFEEEKEVDYSGLRIQNLQIAKDEPEREGEGEEEEYDEDGEVKEKRDGSGPWKKGSAPSSAPAPVEAPKEEPVATAPKAPAKYVPPAQRLAGNTSSSSSHPLSRKKKEAPNLQSEVDFPTLGGGQGGQDNSSSYVIDNPSQRRGMNLTLENKFSALQD